MWSTFLREKHSYKNILVIHGLVFSKNTFNVLCSVQVRKHQKLYKKSVKMPGVILEGDLIEVVSLNCFASPCSMQMEKCFIIMHIQTGCTLWHHFLSHSWTWQKNPCFGEPEWLLHTSVKYDYLFNDLKFLLASQTLRKGISLYNINKL